MKAAPALAPIKLRPDQVDYIGLSKDAVALWDITLSYGLVTALINNANEGHRELFRIQERLALDWWSYERTGE